MVASFSRSSVQPSILVIDDDEGTLASMELCLQPEGYRVYTVATGRSARAAVARGRFDVVLVDVFLAGESGLDLVVELRALCPEADVVVMSGQPRCATVVRAIRLGATDFLEKPTEPSDVKALVRALLAAQEARRPGPDFAPNAAALGAPGLFATRSRRVAELLTQLKRVATPACSVLLGGETGTGKTQHARLIHALSGRAKHPFVVVNAAGLDAALLESQLFGRCKGAFTGARADAPGLVEAAEKGTLFFDEIGEVPLALQPRLLCFFDDRSFSRVGETKRRHAAVRFIFATNRNLVDEVASGRFRADLYHRIQTVAFELIPLRERPEDLPAFVALYVEELAASFGRSGVRLSPAAMELLLDHDWPGNLRELRNVVDTAHIREQFFVAQRRVTARASDGAARSCALMLVVVLAALVGAALLGRTVARHFIAPLDELSRGARAITHGEPDARVHVAAGDELGDVAAALNEMVDDVTDLERRDAGRRDLFAATSHEVRAALESVQTPLRLLEEASLARSDRERTMVATALRGVRRLRETVDTLLTLDRIEDGALRIDRDRVEADALVAQALERARPRATRQELTLTGPSAATGATIEGDARLLGIVLDNLLSNALKYTPFGGTVRVDVARRSGASAAEEGVTISVTDTGPGVPADRRRDVFGKFFRVDDPAAEPGPRGLGIGLYLCAQIVAAHGGALRCEAGDDGKGARFVVDLPMGR